MTRERLFMEWMALKHDIGQLAGIIQNDIKISEDDLCSWLTEVDNFKIKLGNLKLETVRQVRLNK